MSSVQILFAVIGGLAAAGMTWVCAVIAWRLLKSPDR